MLTLLAVPRPIEEVSAAAVRSLDAAGRLPVPTRVGVAGKRRPTVAEWDALRWKLLWSGGNVAGVIGFREVYDYHGGADVVEVVVVHGSPRACVELTRDVIGDTNARGMTCLGSVWSHDSRMMRLLARLGNPHALHLRGRTMTLAEIDAAALAFAHRVSARQPRSDFLFGSPSGEANTVGGYYGAAGNQIQNSVTGPVGQSFVADQNAALQPQFKAQDQNLAAQEAAMGITNSGAAKNDFSNLATGQSAVLAGADAPLYSQALGAYDSNATAGAGAQGQAYETGIQNVDQGIGSFFGAATMAATGGLGGGGGAAMANPYAAANASGMDYSSGFDEGLIP